MKKVFISLLVLGIFITSCTSDNDFNKGKQQLEQQGYTDVVNVGYTTFCCGDDDDFSTGFECKDKNGNVVKGCFCSAMGKGLTIRFE
jgi:hypothetical protein